MPDFRKAEDQQHGADAYHGAGGPIAVRDPIDPHELAEAFIDSAATLGIARTHDFNGAAQEGRSEEHTSELQSLMRISYAVFCLKKKKIQYRQDKATNK